MPADVCCSPPGGVKVVVGSEGGGVCLLMYSAARREDSLQVVVDLVGLAVTTGRETIAAVRSS